MPQLPEEVQPAGADDRKKSSALLQVIALYSTERHLGRRCSCRNYVTINMLDALERMPGVGDSDAVRPARLLHADLVRDRPADQPQPDAERHRRRRSRRRTSRRRSGRIGAQPIADDQQFQLSIQTQGRLTTPEEFGDIIVRANPDGSVLRVRDVARVELGAQILDTARPAQRQARGDDRHLSGARRQCRRRRAARSARRWTS